MSSAAGSALTDTTITNDLKTIAQRQIALKNALQTDLNNSTTLPDVLGPLSNLTNGVNDFNTHLTKYTNDQTPVLTQQDYTQGVLDREYNRLLNKKQSMDQTLATQSRMTLLNQSYAGRYDMYTHMLKVVCGIIVLCVVLVFLKRRFPGMLPDGVVSVLVIVIIAIGIIYCAWKMHEISRRDNIDFNKLSQSTMYTPSVKDFSGNDVIGSATTNSSSSSSVMGTCIGSDCCSVGQTFDVNLNECVDGSGSNAVNAVDAVMQALSGSTQTPFTTISDSEYQKIQNATTAKSTDSLLSFSPYP